MKISPYGDSALLVQFNDGIDESTNREVIALYQYLQASDLFEYLIPAYNSLTIGLDKEKLSRKEAQAQIEAFDFNSLQSAIKPKNYLIPVCYEDAHALDIKEVESLTGLSRDKIIELHSQKTYHVYMLGFLAGFAYMGQLPGNLQVPRKDKPRLSVPKGAVGLAGAQTGIYPCEAPGGWQIIGATPLELFDPTVLEPNLLNPGDRVRFRSITVDEFKLIEIKIATGIYELEYFDD